MPTYFIDPGAATNGTGTAASPFKSWASVPAGAGNVYKQKRGTTYSGAFPSLVSGTSGNLTTIGAYANTDGTDSFLLPRPVIDIGDRIMPGTVNSPRTFMKWSEVDIRCSRATLASDVPIMWLGSDVEISDCNLTSNLTALYGEGCNRVKLLRNKITAATAATATHAINAIVIGGAAPTGVIIDGNEVAVGDGGASLAHVVKVSCNQPIADIQITNNKIRTTSGESTTHLNKAGIFLALAAGADIRKLGTAAATIILAGNDVEGMVDGIFTSSVSNAWIHHNRLNRNNSFGVHATGSLVNPSVGCIAEWNICRRNGKNVSPWYGRAIELSGGGSLNACTRWVIRFNDCSYTANWGGPMDNGTEGVGIGLDDGTSRCLVYGNLCYRCEGQAVQTYAGTTPPADTGGHQILCNYFIECGLAAITNRRSGGTTRTPGACNVSLSGTKGALTTVAYNLFVGGYAGLREGSDCSNVQKYGNVFIDQLEYAIAAASTSGVRANVYKPGVPINIGSLALHANGSAKPVLLSSGVAGDITADPLLDLDRFMPLAGSPLLSRAVAWRSVPLQRSDA
ncbi:hypothetical protein [Massilia sp. BKSP1R2A-1]|uniref:hypothetical protein n=1 Tax=Massilia sp. BKSP1R2A-1 TaxID=3422595 RepID=UPI003D333371